MHVSCPLATTMSSFHVLKYLLQPFFVICTHMWLVKAEHLTSSQVALRICIGPIINPYIDGCDECEGMKRLIWLNGVRIH